MILNKVSLLQSIYREQLTYFITAQYPTNWDEMLAKCGIKSILLSPMKIQHILRPVKDSLGLRHTGVYCIPCECDEQYIGQTGRSVNERCKDCAKDTLDSTKQINQG